MNKVKRICLWCSPRNISTTMMYSFAQRNDTKVFDEPLYGFYLKNSDAAKYHPGAEEIIQSLETDGDKVIEKILHDNSAPVLVFKQMTHHLLDLDLSFLRDTINIVLTRDPDEMIQSFTKVIDNPAPEDLGYPQQSELVRYMLHKNIRFKVLDSKDVLIRPEQTLMKLCNWCEIPFDAKMLSWEPGPKDEDGVWAKYWYDSVHDSTGFIPYKPKNTHLDERYRALYNHVKSHFDFLMKYTLTG